MKALSYVETSPSRSPRKGNKSFRSKLALRSQDAHSSAQKGKLHHNMRQGWLETESDRVTFFFTKLNITHSKIEQANSGRIGEVKLKIVQSLIAMDGGEFCET